MTKKKANKKQRTLLVELSRKVGILPFPGEYFESYAARLALKLNLASDRAWESLSAKAQHWCNETLETLDWNQGRKRLKRMPWIEGWEGPTLQGPVDPCP